MIKDFVKETSERSDSANWVKKKLIEESGYFYESIEGCNQNTENKVTHLFERAKVNIVENEQIDLEIIFEEIKKLEGESTLQRKLNFAKCFNLPLHYVLYCDEKQIVFLLKIISSKEIYHEKTFDNYKDFSNWISEIKGWNSSKKFREIADLPFFDKKLREYGTPWPTNIDCFFTDIDNWPIGIIEFQNADRVGVLNHCNNDYFQCSISETVVSQYGKEIKYHDDIRRWTSQEIIRVQSNLRLIIITWSSKNKDFQIKELEKVSIPYFHKDSDQVDWNFANKYKGALNKYVKSNRSKRFEDNIAQNVKTYNFYKDNREIKYIINEPLLSYEQKTFPSLYYSYKESSSNSSLDIVSLFLKILS